MTESDRQGVRGIVRTWEIFKSEIPLKHGLHLDFRRRSKAGHSDLYHPGIIFHQENSLERHREKDRPSSLRGGGDADSKFRKKKFFNRQNVRKIGIDEPGQFLLDMEKPVGQLMLGRRFNRSKSEEFEFFKI